MNFNGEALFFDPERHGESLALIASLHLTHGRFQLAYQFADRRCRIMTPRARDYLLRSEASRRAGHAAFAAEDLARAIEIDPTDRAVILAALRWGAPEQQFAAAAEAIGESGFEGGDLRRAVSLMAKSGALLLQRLRQAAGGVSEGVSGWIAWAGPSPLHMSVVGKPAGPDLAPPNAISYQIDADPDHPLAGCGFAVAEIAVEDRERRLARLDFRIDDRRVGSFSPTPARAARRKPFRRGVTAQAAPAELLTVIVPVYEDFEATQACFQSLFASRHQIKTRLIVVDDNSPNPRLRGWLEAQAVEHNFHLLRNEENLGFALSVNRALALCPTGDVLLLNADTLLPSGCLDRLAAAAHAAADIGTATPLSNNGEFTSFPQPNVANELGTPQQVAALDLLARQANGDNVVDLPNGVGFCLYIRRDCLDAVGPLPEIYARGYYEDVEFCLRLHEKGFRNVCAVGVYVGHAGSRSFRADKRALVMRNLAKLEARFPNHEAECAAFLEADPLRPARSAIEALIAVPAEVALLVCASGAAEKIARNHAVQLRRLPGDQPRPMLCVHHAADNRLLLRGDDRSCPQSLSFSLADTIEMDSVWEMAAFRAYIARLNLRQIVFFDPLALPEPLVSTLLTQGADVELVCGDLQWIYRPFQPRDGRCDEAGTVPCNDCLAAGFASNEGSAGLEGALGKKQALLRVLLERARAVRPVDRMGEAFAHRLFKDKAVARLHLADEAAAPKAKLGSLGVLAPTANILADRLIIALAREFLRRGDPTQIIVLGGCVDDLEVMATGNVFVAGNVADGEYDRLIRQCEVGALMSPYRTGFFGFVDGLSHKNGLAKAYFDWSFALLSVEDGDLSLDPRLCDAKAARAMATWFRAPSQPTGAP